MENKKYDFVIIDGDSFIHRAYHGYKSNKFATEKNYAIKGFLEMISRVLNDYDYKYLAIVFDYQGECFRHELSSVYKANRKEKEPLFLEQIKDIHKAVKASGLPSFCVKGVEGDDTIGVLTRKAQSLNWTTAIFSGDKDLSQLLDENTTIIDTNKRTQKIINLNDIEKYFGVKNPEQIIDLLAIKGDVADNIIGLKDCGDKTASFLLNNYKNLEEIMNEDKEILASKIKSIVRSKDKVNSIIYQLEHEKEKLLLSKELTKIRDNADNLNLSMKDIKIKENRVDKALVLSILKKYNLKLEYSFSKEIINLLNK